MLTFRHFKIIWVVSLAWLLVGVVASYESLDRTCGDECTPEQKVGAVSVMLAGPLYWLPTSGNEPAR